MLVPRYNPDAVAAPQPFNAPRAQGVGPEAFGAGVGTGLQGASHSANTVIGEEIDKANRTAAIESRTSLDQAEVDLLYHPEKGALAKRGKDAFNIEETTLQTFDAKTGEIENSLGNEAQKNAFRLMAGQRRVEVDKQIQRHVHGEMKTYAEETNKASLESTLNNVITNYQDPERVEQERKFGLAVIMSDTENKGLPPALVKMKIDTWESMVQKGVIERMAVTDPVKAKEYFEANRDKLLGTEAVKIEHTLKPLAEAQEGLSAANKVFYATDPKTPLADMVKAIHDQFPNSPNVVKHAEGEIHSLYAAREEGVKKAIDAAEKSIYSYLTPITLAGKVPKRSDVPADAWLALSKLDPEKADKIGLSLQQRQEHATDRGRAEKDRLDTKATEDNLTTWGLLKTDPKHLGTVNLDALLHEHKINKSQYQDLKTDQLAISTGKGDHETKILSDKAAVDSVLATVKITQKKDAAGYAKFYQKLTEKMKTFEVDNTRKPKQDEVLTMARGLLAEVSQDVSFWPIDKTVPAFKADLAKVRVPAEDRKAIEAALKKNGRPVTDDAIKQLYIERKTRGGQ
jgi:hypothetical protein